MALARLMLLLLPAFFGALLIAWDPPPLPRLRDIAFDVYQRLLPAALPDDPPAIIVAIDDAALRDVGQWPWPRDRLADLLKRLTEAGAAVVAFDVLFAEVDDAAPLRLLQKFPESPERTALLQTLGADADTDSLFARALGASPAVLGVIAGDAGGPFQPKAGFANAGDPVLPFLHRYSGVRLPIPPLAKAASGLGTLNWVPDGDGIVRRVPTLVAVNGVAVPSLFVEALRVAQGATTLLSRGSNAGGETAFGASSGMNALRIGAITIDTEPTGEVRLHARPTAPQLYISASDVLSGRLKPGAVAGRIVFVGATAPALGDRRVTPLEDSIPGVELHVQAVEAALSNRHLTRPDWMRGFESVATAGLGLMIAVLMGALRKRPGYAVAAGATLAMLIPAASALAFERWRVLIDPVVPTLVLAGTLMVGMAILSRDLEKRRAQVRETFGRFVAPSVVERLAETSQPLVIGGENRELTVLFSDIRGFTALSEHRDPASVVALLRRIHTPASAAVMAHGGTLDKYLGDGMMAFWNAPLDDPDHATHACLAALAVVEAVEGRFEEPITIGIGLHTGTACVGNLGSDTRLEYSALGDAVNLTSRLEGLTKLYGVSIIVSEATARQANGLTFVALDTVRVTGRNDPVAILTLLAAPAPAFADAQAQLLEALQSRRLEDAEAVLALPTYGERPALVALYRDRIRVMQANPERSAVNEIGSK